MTYELATDKKELVVNCPLCGMERRSQSYSTTLVGYSSPKGHNHDDNCRKFTFRCKDNHHFRIRVRNICSTPGCDWKGREFCSTCGDNVKFL